MITGLITMCALSLPAQLPARPPSRYSRPSKYAGAIARQAEEERLEMLAMQKAQQEYEKRYKEMLPFMLEQQRQMLQRQSAMERNRALNRMAAATERQARATEQLSRSTSSEILYWHPDKGRYTDPRAWSPIKPDMRGHD